VGADPHLASLYLMLLKHASHQQTYITTYNV